MNLGIFLPNWIGDVVMATPALRALRRHYGPQARIVGIMRPYVAEVLVGTPWLDERLYFDPRSKNHELHGWRFARRLRRERFDAVILLTNSLRTGFWAWASGARQRVGYARDVRSMFLTHKLYAPMAGGHYAPQPTLDAYLQIAYALGCPKEPPRMELATTTADEQAADEVWRILAIPQDKPVVLLNSGAAFGASKLWPTEYFGQLAKRIAAEWGYTVLAICGPRERDIVRKITAVAEHPQVVSLADARLGDSFPLPIGLSKACVRRAALMVTTDSGPRHFAAAFNVPVITLFGPTPISLSDTHFARAVNLNHEVPCGPCLEQVCPLQHHQCMRDLTVDHVYRAVQTQLSALADPRVPKGSSWNEYDASDDSGPLVIPSWNGGGGARTSVASRTTPQARPLARRQAVSPTVVAAGREVLQLPIRPEDVDSSVPGAPRLWINDGYRRLLAEAKLDEFTAIMATTDGRLMRALPDRENWRLQLHAPHATSRGAFLKKHHERSLALWMRARLGRSTPASPGRVEAENITRLESAGIRSMNVIAFGEQLHTDGLLESFVLTEELLGFAQLDDYLRQRFPDDDVDEAEASRRKRDFRRLLERVAEVAGRFHRLGYNHRDLYCCHFFIREQHPGEFDVRLIDLQRVQHRTRLRRRWIVKDLAQLAYSAPRELVSCRHKLAFFKIYLGVAKLRLQDKRLLRSILRKQGLMEMKLGPHP